MTSRTFALIPAAGKSTRMGTPKLSLPLGNRTVIEKVLQAFRRAGVDEVVVVLAPHSAPLSHFIAKEKASILQLKEETPDMRSTVEKGLGHLEEEFKPGKDDWWFLCPADHPTLNPQVISRLLETKKQPNVSIPTHQGKRGHPALIGWNHVDGIRRLPENCGLNAYFRSSETLVKEVDVPYEEILWDLDTPEDYERLRRWTMEKK